MYLIYRWNVVSLSLETEEISSGEPPLKWEIKYLEIG